MATQFFSDEQMERLRSYPDIGREELIRFFTLTRKDLGFIDNLARGGGRGPAAHLGLAVQLCTLPWLGFVPDDIWSVPQAAVLRLANQLAVGTGALEPAEPRTSPRPRDRPRCGGSCGRSRPGPGNSSASEQSGPRRSA